MQRQYRRFDKRRAYSDYSIQSKALHAQLKDGKIKQDEFDRAHELLDERYGWVK
jgi:hypothetical protein